MPQDMLHENMEQFGLDGLPPEFNGMMPPEIPAAEAEPVQITFHREAPKVGRNDLCPCGKKYKKCCGKDN